MHTCALRLSTFPAFTQTGGNMSSLLISPDAFRNRTNNFGFEFLSFATRKLDRGERYEGSTDGTELAIVVLGGTCSVESSRGKWSDFGGRKTVFDGMPYTLYLPPSTQFTVIGG